MKQNLLMFIIHQTATRLQRIDNLNPRTIWYHALDESNRMKSAYFTIHPGNNPPHQNGCWLKSGFFFKHRFHILHFPKSAGLFTKPTGRQYIKYWFSPDIDPNIYIHIGAEIIDLGTQTSRVWWTNNSASIMIKISRYVRSYASLFAQVVG
jgi:hypothetical protein